MHRLAIPDLPPGPLVPLDDDRLALERLEVAVVQPVHHDPDDVGQVVAVVGVVGVVGHLVGVDAGAQAGEDGAGGARVLRGLKLNDRE